MKYLLHLLLFVCIAPLTAQNTAVDKAIKELVDDPSLKYASLGFHAVDVQSGQTISSHNANTALIPASSLKTVTTAAAIGILGEDFKFKTELQTDGKISNGVLKGNLYIKGYGDPSLGAGKVEGSLNMQELMLVWVKAIRNAGIQKIEGAIIGDDTYYNANDAVSGAWQWMDLGNGYGAGAYALNINENTYSAFFKRDGKKIGDWVKVSRISPEVPHLSLKSEVRIGDEDADDDCYIYMAPFGTEGLAKGKVPTGKGEFEVEGSVPDPSLFAAHQLRLALLKNKISVSKAANTQRALKSEATRQTIYTYYSPRLFKLAERTNVNSVNLYAECILKAIALKQSGKASIEEGVKAVREFWEGRGIDPRAMVIDDGSGLSARNSVTAKTLADILRKAKSDTATFGNFEKTLAIAGKTGTLRKWCDGTAAEGKIWAKSGSMSRVRSYSGYALTQSGKWVAFSIIINNFHGKDKEMREKLEKFAIALVGL